MFRLIKPCEGFALLSKNDIRWLAGESRYSPWSFRAACNNRAAQMPGQADLVPARDVSTRISKDTANKAMLFLSVGGDTLTYICIFALSGCNPSTFAHYLITLHDYSPPRPTLLLFPPGSWRWPEIEKSKITAPCRFDARVSLLSFLFPAHEDRAHFLRTTVYINIAQ